MDLGEWLKAQNLEVLADVLRANDVDLDVLPELTDQDLERLGLSLGHRRRLLKAAASLAPASAPTAAAAAPPAVASERETAERRQVTVMFCDLVGSTELSARLDPEDMQDVIRGYQDVCAGAIARFDGFLAKLMGDGVLAYFGFPHAHEDAAERAVRAALAIVAAMPDMRAADGTRLVARIGIATGLVVVGDIVGTGVAREQSIVGETPNLAARLQGLAAPGEILVSQSTQRLLGRLFDLEDAGTHALKGFAQPVPAWRVRGESALFRRFAAARDSAVPFVGRETEMGLLLDRWRLAAAGEGQFVLLTGEAGIGKSRVADALREHCQDEAVFAAFQCSPHHANTALYPMIRYLEIAAGFAAGDPPRSKLEKLEAFLTPASTAARTLVPLFAPLMSLPVEECPSVSEMAVPEMTPAQRKTATIAAFIDHMVQVAAWRPVLFLLEDAHWIDPTSAELVGQLVDAIQAARVLVVVTARPDFVSPWTGRPHATQLALSRLSRAHCAEMVIAVAAAHAIAPEIRDDIVAKTDGVPLFVQELTKTILETASTDRAAVPATLQDSLMARLDRLGEAKDVAQIAAVIGRQFSHSLLAAVAPGSGADLDRALERLIQSEIVFPQRQALEPGYSFRHALMRDAAYDSLLRARRQALHGRVAKALEQEFPAIVAEEPELLAYHHASAGNPEAASLAHERAGDLAASRSAYKEAVAHFEAALAQARKLPDQAQRELALSLKIYTPMSILKSPQSPEVADLAASTYQLARGLGDSPDLFKATWNLWMSANLGKRRDEAGIRVKELVALGERLGDEDLLFEAIHCRWSTAFFGGDLAMAHQDSRDGIRRYDPARHRELGTVFAGHDPGVCAYTIHALTLSVARESEATRRALASAVSLAEKLGHPHSLGHAYQLAMYAQYHLGDAAAVADAAARLVALGEKWNFPLHHAIGRYFEAWAQTADSNLEAGLARMEAEYERAASLAPFPNYFALMLARERLAAGRVQDALELAEQALAGMAGPDPGFYLPDLLEVRASCRARLGLDGAAVTPALQDLVRRYDSRLAALKAAITRDAAAD
ncbi:MAG TPA: adenylate/guanylate cyclase domain-containing protein [Alphaproteobacteria bacterium]|nr:adenylate/guanylate cyclase domain-containing protein [Alphaproteobacteria bacterium]